MTSTNFNIGLGDSSRPSSRVLRPPGGGHTNIFGSAEPEPIKKDMGRNASSILEGTNATTNPTPQGPAKPSSTSTGAVSQPAPPQQSQRAKVPPGGFSSGLW